MRSSGWITEQQLVNFVFADVPKIKMLFTDTASTTLKLAHKDAFFPASFAIEFMKGFIFA